MKSNKETYRTKTKRDKEGQLYLVLEINVATCSQGLPHLGQESWLSLPLPPPLELVDLPLFPDFPLPTPKICCFVDIFVENVGSFHMTLGILPN